MPHELTAYDPAEDLIPDKAIAAFMAETFETKDAGHCVRIGRMDSLRRALRQKSVRPPPDPPIGCRRNGESSRRSANPRFARRAARSVFGCRAPQLPR